MKTTRQSRLMRLRALVAAIALLIGSASAQAALAVNRLDVCSMDCCVEQGHCCCSPGHAFVKGQALGERPVITESKLSAPCPDGCATSLSSSLAQLKAVARSGQARLDLGHSIVSKSDGERALYDFIRQESSSPRGPPALPTLAA
jgi:hypothetical protein